MGVVIPGPLVSLAPRNDVWRYSLAKMRVGAQRQVKISVPRPALLAASPYAPLPVLARALAGIPPPAPAGFKPEFS
jgi:hypothetical protein